MPDVNVDLIGNEGGQGAVAVRIAQEGELNANAMRPFIGKDGRTYMSVYTGKGNPRDLKNYRAIPITIHGTLRRDEWKQLDEAILPIAESRLGGVQDLISKGLTYQLGNGMGTTVLEYHDISDALEAELTMDGVTRSKGDRQVFGTVYLPIPIISVDYEINKRVLEVSRRLGNPLDTTMAERAARKVAEKLESMLFTDTDYTFGGGVIYSYVNFPYRAQHTISASWSTDTAAGIIDDVITMKQTSIDNHFYGPWVLYIPTAYETVMDQDYVSTTATVTTIRQRLMAIEGISAIKVIDTLPDDNVVMVQMTSDVVRLVQGMALTNVEWDTEGKMITKYKVLTIQVPQIRADQNHKTGIVHGAV